MLVLGIDASNLRGGGGVTHLVEMLQVARPDSYGVDRIVVWGRRHVVRRLPERPWLKPMAEPFLDGALSRQILWQQIRLSRAMREEGCGLLFVPGGTHLGGFQPFITMSRNLLPFDLNAQKHFGLSRTRLRLLLLRRVQVLSFRRAEGVIFLTETARQVVERCTGPLQGRSVVIPHGVAECFRQKPREQESLERYSPERPFRLLYVSVIRAYKHQWNVAEAAARLRNDGMPVIVDFVGPADQLALRRLNRSIEAHDPNCEFLFYRGPVPYQDLPRWYHGADAFVFASSCENMPNILLEAMASGLPIASSNKGPMPEILGEAGVYFDPEDVTSITEALVTIVSSFELRQQWAWKAYKSASCFSWERCAHETFGFLRDVWGRG